MYNFTNLKQALLKSEEWLKKEFSLIRTSRASSSILDGVFVESYGAKVPLNQVANIMVEDSRSIRINPWDSSNVKNIEKGIVSANLGVSVSVDEKGVRVSFPDLTTERRTEIVKMAKEKYEQARIQVRTERDKIWTDIQDKEKKGQMPEDDKFRFKKDMEKLIEDANKKLDEAFAKKEKEVMN